MKPATSRGASRQDYRTPAYLFSEITARFGPFDIDLAASEGNALCVDYFDAEADALTQEWRGRCWCNPPYKDIAPWIYKAVHSVHVSKSSRRVVMLLPARLGTDWFKWASMWGVIHRISGRVKFELETGPVKSPPEYSVIAIFERDINMKELFVTSAGNGKAKDEASDNPAQASPE